MGGVFGVVAQEDCASDLFYGTDYHSHLGTKRAGMAVLNGGNLRNAIHNIENSPFRTKLMDDLPELRGHAGIGVISDYDDQPLIVGSPLGPFAIVTVGRINNSEALTERAYARGRHFLEMSGGAINPTELVASLVSEGDSFAEGIRHAQELIEGSCTFLLLTPEGIYAARDRFGRTPLVTGQRDGAAAVSMETCAFPNLGYQIERYLGPGEIVHISRNGIEQVQPPGEELRVCAFLWVYYGYPASSYEGVNAEAARNRCGAALARRESADADMIAGIPDSGTGHGIGYAHEAGIPFKRPFVKYTPTWPRSFMPQNQTVRDTIASMKLIPIRELIDGQRVLFCDDSIVRGTQLLGTIQRLYEYGATEVHMRVACPPLVYGCPYLNFSRSKSEMDLASRKAIRELEDDSPDLAAYATAGSPCYCAMVDKIRERLGLTSLAYQQLDDLIEAIGLPRDHLCTYCWNAVG